MTGERPWGGTYANNPFVEVAYRHVAEAKTYPHLCVLSWPGSRTMPGTQERYEDVYQAAVIGYVRETATVPAVELVEHLIRDCKVAILSATKAPAQLYVDDFGDEDVEFTSDGHGAFVLPFTAHLEDALD